MTDKYRIIFFRYLYKKLDMEEIEEYLISNNVGYISDEKLMCYEEKICHRYAKYFYLLNDIDLSMLKEDELAVLRKIKEDDMIDNKIIDYLEKTYQKVFFSDSRGLNKYYGAISPLYMAKDNQIVLGFKRDEMGFANHKLKKRNEMEHDDIVINEVIKRIHNTLNMDVKVIIYNELFEKHLKQN